MRFVCAEDGDLKEVVKQYNITQRIQFCSDTDTVSEKVRGVKRWQTTIQNIQSKCTLHVTFFMC